MKLTTLSSAITLLITSGLIMGCNSDSRVNSHLEENKSKQHESDDDTQFSRTLDIEGKFEVGKEVTLTSKQISDKLKAESILLTNASFKKDSGIISDLTLNSISFYALASGPTEIEIEYMDTQGLTKHLDLNFQTMSPTLDQHHRFLQQASFGPTSSELETRKQVNFLRWINKQIDIPPTSHQNLFQQLDETQESREDVWLRIATKSEDQLRQRTAFALSQLFVISRYGSLHNKPMSMVNYYDELVFGAFGNFRDLLKTVTLHPAMGIYLTMINSEKENIITGAMPDENYAREIMQLFTIGLYQLNLDGSLYKDQNGDRIASYSQDDVKNIARAFTGWKKKVDDFNLTKQMVANNSKHDNGEKIILGTIVPAGQSATEDLDNVLDILFFHKNTPPFFAKHMIQRLVSSDPSPEYIARIANVFINNGQNVRGDIGAVVKAILTDKEALGFGQKPPIKVKEPILTVMNLFRAMNVQFSSEKELYSDRAYYRAQQGPLRANSVFNFYSPEYKINGTDIVSPEMELLTWSNYISTYNYMRKFVISYTSPLLPDYSVLARHQDVEMFINKIDLVFFGGEMTDELRDSIRNHIDKSGGKPFHTWLIQQVLQLVISSDEFFVQD
ncbi:DUF1800 family protein [Vibrio sp. NTOU-M3]|uniref:DUF1800 domain-containing protein n=1 Tax=Vibrio sp. NTOU-M3 TaxID=3234954 RepID=UPI00349FC283